MQIECRQNMVSACMTLKNKPTPCDRVCYPASVVFLVQLADNLNEGLVHCFCLPISLWGNMVMIDDALPNKTLTFF